MISRCIILTKIYQIGILPNVTDKREMFKLYHESVINFNKDINTNSC